MSAKEWIRRLNMTQHPEGGWYVESFRDPRVIEERNASTAIYFLIEKGVPSHFHQIRSAELWHFYCGASLIVHELSEQGYTKHMVGPNWDKGESFQTVIPAFSWFGAETTGEYSLVGCTVAPGFSFHDFTLAKRDTLTEEYGAHAQLIKRLTRD